MKEMETSRADAVDWGEGGGNRECSLGDNPLGSDVQRGWVIWGAPILGEKPRVSEHLVDSHFREKSHLLGGMAPNAPPGWYFRFRF